MGEGEDVRFGERGIFRDRREVFPFSPLKNFKVGKKGNDCVHHFRTRERKCTVIIKLRKDICLPAWENDQCADQQCEGITSTFYSPMN